MTTEEPPGIVLLSGSKSASNKQQMDNTDEGGDYHIIRMTVSNALGKDEKPIGTRAAAMAVVDCPRRDCI